MYTPVKGMATWVHTIGAQNLFVQLSCRSFTNLNVRYYCHIIIMIMFAFVSLYIFVMIYFYSCVS